MNKTTHRVTLDAATVAPPPPLPRRTHTHTRWHARMHARTHTRQQGQNTGPATLSAATAGRRRPWCTHRCRNTATATAAQGTAGSASKRVTEHRKEGGRGDEGGLCANKSKAHTMLTMKKLTAACSKIGAPAGLSVPHPWPLRAFHSSTRTRQAQRALAQAGTARLVLCGRHGARRGATGLCGSQPFVL